jgi:glycosyltransferase involved in cell wall biosynthesis
MPVISTDVAGARDAIADAGITVEGEDVVGTLCEALLSLVDDRAELARLVAATRERSALLNGPRMIDETEALYRKLVNR